MSGYSPSTPTAPAVRRQLLSPRLRAGLLVALLLLAWLSWPRPPAAHLVAVGREHIAAKHPHLIVKDQVKQSGAFGTYKLTFTADRGMDDVVRIVLRIRDHGDRLELLSEDVMIGSGGSFPMWLLHVAILFAVAYLVLFVSVPRSFGRKCPRDAALLKSRETTVLAPQVDSKGLMRASIIERWHECPKCDFKHIEALADPGHRPSVLSEDQVRATARLTEGEVERMQESIRSRLATAMTAEEYSQRLGEAKEDARRKSSPDSPWLQS